MFHRAPPLRVGTAALLASACTTPIPPPGIRGDTVPRHVKNDSYEVRAVPRTPMTTKHRLETHDDCGPQCDFIQRSRSVVTIQLSENGVARAEDAGDLTERVRSATTSSSSTTKWSRTWTGSWSEGDDALELVLKPDTISCQRTAEGGAVDEECGQRRDLRLRCQMTALPLIRPLDSTERAWACTTRGYRVADGITRLPWIFGLKQPVVVLDGGTTHEPTRRYALASTGQDNAPRTRRR